MFIDSNAAITISLPEKPPINAADALPLDADAKKKQLVENFLSDALNKKNGYTVYVEEGDKLSETGSALEVVKRFVDLVEQGRPVGISIPDGSYCWKIDSKKKMEELVFSVTDNKELLSDDTRKGIMLINKLKKKDIHFFTNNNPKKPRAVKLSIGPLLLIESGSLWAAVGMKGERRQVVDLKAFAKEHNIDPDTILANKSSLGKAKMQMVTLTPIVMPQINNILTVVPLNKVEDSQRRPDITSKEVKDESVQSSDITSKETAEENKQDTGVKG